MRNKLLVEAVGTFFLCLAVLVSGGPLPVAALLCALLYMGAPISLPHYNPAVTLAFRLRGRISTRTLGAFLGVQFLAAFVAALVAGVARRWRRPAGGALLPMRRQQKTPALSRGCFA